MTGPDSKIERQKKPDFEKLWEAHPLIRHGEKGIHPCQRIHTVTVDGKQEQRSVATFDNQCVVRLFVALKELGYQPPLDEIPETCGVHGKHEMHIPSTKSAIRLLEKYPPPGFKKPIKLYGDAVRDFFLNIPNKRGILYAGDYWTLPGQTVPTISHIDFWNGYRTCAKPLIVSTFKAGMLPNYALSQELWFFEKE